MNKGVIICGVVAMGIHFIGGNLYGELGGELVSERVPGLEVSVSATGDSTQPGISGDGRYVVFVSDAPDLVRDDGNGIVMDVFLKDLDTDEITLVSRGLGSESGANGPSHTPAISADGRWVAFVSEAGDLVAGDTNEVADIFLWDRERERLRLISRNADGHSGNGRSWGLQMSFDGGRLVFESEASDLVEGDENNEADIFIFERESGRLRLVSGSMEPGMATGRSFGAVMDPAGETVVFRSASPGMAGHDTLDAAILLSDFTKVIPVVLPDPGGETNAPARAFNLEVRGEAVWYQVATNDWPSPPEWHGIYRYSVPEDRMEGYLSMAEAGNITGYDDDSDLSISRTGRYLAAEVRMEGEYFPSSVAVLDTEEGAITMIAAGNIRGFSPDERYLAFVSQAEVIPGDHNGEPQLYLMDLRGGDPILVSRGVEGKPATGGVDFSGMSFHLDGEILEYATAGLDFPVIAFSADGNRLVFQSWAKNLVAGDTNGGADIFVYDMNSQKIELISTRATEFLSETPSAISLMKSGGMSEDGRLFVFTSYSDGLVEEDANGRPDVFLKDMESGQLTLVSRRPDGMAAELGGLHPLVSCDGSTVSYFSLSPDIVEGVTNRQKHIFLYEIATGETSVLEPENEPWILPPPSQLAWSGDARFVAVGHGDEQDRIFSRDIVLYDRREGGHKVFSEAAAPAIDSQGTMLVFYGRRPDSSNMGLVIHDLLLGEGFGIEYEDILHYPREIRISRNGAWIAASFLEYNSLIVFQNVPFLGWSLAYQGPAPTSYRPWIPQMEFAEESNHLVFSSVLDGLVEGDQNGFKDIYLFDPDFFTVSLVSAGLDGAPANGSSGDPAISADGRYIYFSSRASNLVAGDTNGTSDLFVRDRLTGTTIRLTDSKSPIPFSYRPQINRQANLLAYVSLDPQGGATDRNSLPDVYVTDLPDLGGGDGLADGMDDSWEFAYFGTLERTGNDDFDGDGLSDREEFLLGSDPTNRRSGIMVEIEKTPEGSLRLQWPILPEQTFGVQYKTRLGEPEWTDLEAEPDINDTTGSVIDPISGRSRYYRVIRR